MSSSAPTSRYIFILCVACMYVLHMPAKCLQRLRECVGAPGVRDSCGYWELNRSIARRASTLTHRVICPALASFCVWLCICVYSWRPEKGEVPAITYFLPLRQGLSLEWQSHAWPLGSSVCSSCLHSKCCDSLSHCSTPPPFYIVLVEDSVSLYSPDCLQT